MELLENNVCRLCLFVSPDNIENLFENNDIWTKISLTLKVNLQPKAYLPNGICYACTAITDHIHSFHQKIIQSQNILNKKLNEGTNSLQQFFSTLKSMKIENIGIDLEKICESVKTDDKIDIFINEDVTVDKLPTKTVKSEANTQKDKFIPTETIIEPWIKANIQEKVQDPIILQNEQNTVNVSLVNIKSEGSDFDEIFAQESASEDSDWKPQTNLKVKVKKRKTCKDDNKNNVIAVSTCTQSNIFNTNSDKENIDDKKIPTSTTDAESRNMQNNMREQMADKKNYKCLTCFEIFQNRKSLTIHFAAKHKPNISVSADVNLENFTTFREDNKKLCKCGYCGKVSKKKYIKTHISVVHNKMRPYVCNICGKTFKQVSEIITHNRAHNGLSLFCSYNCGFSTTYMHSLKKHEMGKHKGEYKYKCECGKGFDVKTWYEDHQNEHTGVKPYVCPVCQYAYHKEKQLKAHSKRVHLKSEEETAEEIRFLCTLCSHPCDNMPVLNDRLFKKHGIRKKYLCDMCGKSFNTSSRLHNHKRAMHSDAKPYPCSQCDMSFKFRTKLRRHQMSHMKERPHACHRCEKRYARPQGLRHHLLTCHSTKKEDQGVSPEAS